MLYHPGCFSLCLDLTLFHVSLIRWPGQDNGRVGKGCSFRGGGGEWRVSLDELHLIGDAFRLSSSLQSLPAIAKFKQAVRVHLCHESVESAKIDPTLSAAAATMMII